MRIMGLDVGSKTVGVAISDPLGFTAQGLEIIPIDEEKNSFGFERLSELVKQYQVDKFVVGLPKSKSSIWKKNRGFISYSCCVSR